MRRLATVILAASAALAPAGCAGAREQSAEPRGVPAAAADEAAPSIGEVQCRPESPQASTPGQNCTPTGDPEPR